MLRSAAGRLLAGRHGVASGAGGGVRRGRRRTGHPGVLPAMTDVGMDDVLQGPETRVTDGLSHAVRELGVALVFEPGLDRREFPPDGVPALGNDLLETEAEVAVIHELIQERGFVQRGDRKAGRGDLRVQIVSEELVLDTITGTGRQGDCTELANTRHVLIRNRRDVLLGHSHAGRRESHRENRNRNRKVLDLHSFIPSFGSWNGKSRRISWTAR